MCRCLPIQGAKPVCFGWRHLAHLMGRDGREFAMPGGDWVELVERLDGKPLVAEECCKVAGECRIERVF